MMRYWYRGRYVTGERGRGLVMATDFYEAMEMLKGGGLHVTMLRPLPQCLGEYRKERKKMTAGDMLAFSQQMGVLLESGISLVKGLQLILLDMNSPKMQRWVRFLLVQIDHGQPLAKAMAMGEYQVPVMLLELVSMGERQGKLGRAFRQGAAYFERELRWKNDLLTALLYPAVVLMVMVVAVLAMMIFVVPSLTQTYQSLSAPIPVLTRGFIKVSYFVQAHGITGLAVLLAGGALGFWGLKVSGRMQRVKLVIYKGLTRSKGLKKMLQERYYIQFAQMLGQLLESGVLLVDALELLKEHYRGLLFTQELHTLRDNTLQGMALAEGMTRCSFVPQAALQMVRIGEESGRLSEMLLYSSDYYDEQMDRKLMRMIKILEPILIVLLGLLILLIAGGLLLPIFSVYQYIG